MQGGFQGAYIMTGGGPFGKTMTLQYYIYQKAFMEFKPGYAATIAWFLFLIVFILTLFNWRYAGRKVQYF